MYSCVIADASEVFREGFQRLLHDHNDFQCVFASASGDEALRACVRYRPDFIVVDERLHDQTSTALVSRLSKLQPAPLVIGTSLFNEQSVRQRFLDAGAAFIPKTLLMSALPQELAELLGTCATQTEGGAP